MSFQSYLSQLTSFNLGTFPCILIKSWRPVSTVNAANVTRTGPHGRSPCGPHLRYSLSWSGSICLRWQQESAFLSRSFFRLHPPPQPPRCSLTAVVGYSSFTDSAEWFEWLNTTCPVVSGSCHGYFGCLWSQSCFESASCAHFSGRRLIPRVLHPGGRACDRSVLHACLSKDGILKLAL